jgi:membrane associated rhomboid family serine protease
VLYPRARVLTVILIIFFFTVIEIPALVMLGIWFLQQLIFGALDFGNPVGGGGVAYFAHIGGFAFGLLTIRVLVQRVKTAPQRLPLS